MKKKVAAVLVLTLLGAGIYWGYGRYASEREPAGLQATGTIEATQVELRAKLPGVLQNLTADAGSRVKEGQVLAVVARNDLVAQKERDALGVLKAQAMLADLASGAREQEIKEAEIAVNTAEVNHDRAAKDYERARVLFEEKVISESEMEKLETAFKQSGNQLDQARSRLSLLQSGSRPDQIEAARAELDRNAAVLKASEALLEDTKIICPIDGTVLSKNFQEGEFVQAGASVATVANLDDMWIRVYLPTDDLPRIRLGQQVRFTVSGGPAEYKGTIEEIASRGEFTPKTIQTKKERTNIVYGVKIRIGSENGVLKPGMPADVIFD